MAAENGSSPRVRGEHPRHPPHLHTLRIIPACAGRTTLSCPWAMGWTDHPRVCGANPLHHPLRHHRPGSSPRVRGERGGGGQCRGSGRIIPACAGRTPEARLWRRRPSDHPRVCGANPVMVGILDNANGSSPRVRGERVHDLEVVAAVRIIPACAGRTSMRVSACRMTPDHPRVCGANSASHWPSGGTVGSSPRVRGERSRHGLEEPRERIIPACAGRTAACRRR